MGFQLWQQFNIAIAVLLGVTALTTIIFFVLSLFLVRRKGDPARLWLFYLRVTLFFFAGDILWATLCSIINVVVDTNLTRAELASVIDQLSSVATLADRLTLICLLLCLVRLNKGMSVIYNGQITRSLKYAIPASYGLAGLVGLLAVIGWIVRIKVLQTTNWTLSNEVTSPLASAEVGIDFTIVVVLLLATLSFLGYTGRTLRRSKASLKAQPTIFLLVSTILLCIRLVYDFAIRLVSIDFDQVVYIRPAALQVPIIEVVFGFWTIFVALILLFILGIGKGGGPLWSPPTPSTVRPDVTAFEQHREGIPGIIDYSELSQLNASRMSSSTKGSLLKKHHPQGSGYPVKLETPVEGPSQTRSYELPSPQR